MRPTLPAGISARLCAATRRRRALALAGALAAALAAGLAPAARAAFSEGMTAFEAEDYTSALREWVDAAGGGDVKSLYGLGTLFAGGLGVPQDFQTAHLLFNLAAFKGDAQSASARDAVEEKMSPAQIREAKRQVLEMVEQERWLPAEVRALAQQGGGTPARQPAAGERSAPAGAPAPRAAAAPAIDYRFACRMQMRWQDKGSGGSQDLSIHDAAPPAGYQVVGAYAQGNFHPTDGCVMALREREPGGRRLLAPPAEWRQSWADKGSGARLDGSIWLAVPPEPAFVCLGAVGQRGYDKPAPRGYACVHECLVKPVPVTHPIWTTERTGAREAIALYRLPVSNAFVAASPDRPPEQLLDIDPAATCR